MLTRIDRDRKDYADRGIAVCDRWRSFISFHADLGDPPTGATLERINNDGNYEPGNCKWASRKEQARNTRRNVRIIYQGREQSLAAWAEWYGVSYWKLYSRHKAGWTVERMFRDLVRAV